MTAITTYTLLTNSTDANFRIWGSSVDGTFVTCGWVQTSDTGQINWTTVAAPVAINTSKGYSIFRMNDAMQATKPVFLKIEYGSSPAVVANPCMWITIGTGSDGAGTITGITVARSVCYGNTSNGSYYPSYFSGSSSRWCMCLWPTYASYQHIFFSVERTHDDSNTLTNTGLLIFFTSYPQGAWSQYAKHDGSLVAYYQSGWNCNVPPGLVTNSALGNKVNAYPVKCWTPGESEISTNVFVYFQADFSGYNPITLNLFDNSVTGTYIPMPLNTSWAQACNRGAISGLGLMMRYD